jgi:ribosomal protein L31
MGGAHPSSTLVLRSCDGSVESTSTVIKPSVDVSSINHPDVYTTLRCCLIVASERSLISESQIYNGDTRSGLSLGLERARGI